MSAAPTPDDVRALAERLEHCVAKWGKQNALSLEAYSAVKMLRRLQADNERLRADQAQAMSEASSLAMSLFQKHYSSDPDYASGAVNFGLCDELRGAISQIDNMSTGLTRAELEARKPLLSDAEVIQAQESLALYRSRIGLPCSRCGTGKYRADCNAYHDFHRCDSCMHVPMWGADGNELSPAPLIASREVVADGPVRVTRLHLTDEGRAALTSKAAGPLPGITGGPS